MSLTIAAILAAASTGRAETPCPACGETSAIPCSCVGREAVKVLCAGLTDEQLRAEIRRNAAAYRMNHGRRHARSLARDYRHARAALETERDRRSHEAAIATLPEDRR